MRILAAGDMHGTYQAVLDYLKKNHVDIIILTGDITDFGPLELAEDILNELSLFGVLLLAIPGNCDPVGIQNTIDNSRAINIHSRSTTIGNIGIGGFGGSNPTPFNTPLEFEEEQIQSEVEKVTEQIKDQEVRILVTHAPPFDTKTDIILSGHHVGSKSLRKIIEEFQPSLNICGHIHEARAIDKVEDTIIINSGEASKGFACMIDISEGDGGIKITPKLIKL